MAGFNDYQSGGKGFNSPDKIIENATYREFMQQAGGKEGLASKDQADVVNILNNILDQLVQNTNISNEQTNEIKSALHERVMGTANAPQAAKEGTSLLNSFIKSNTELIKGLSQQKSLTGNERGTLGSISNSSLKQLVMLNQGILNTLKQIAVGVNTSAGIFDKFHADFIEIDASNDKREDKASQEQLGKLDLVRQIIAYGLFSSPTVNKLQQLGTSLMGLGLMKVMGSNAPEPIKKLAAGAIYLQIPQTLMQIIGIVVTQSLSKWLMTSASNLLKNGLKDGLANPAKNMFGNLGAILPRIFAATMSPLGLAIIAVGAIVAGVLAHKNKMKESDAKIDADKTLTDAQKRQEKYKAHSASGARAGMASGAITGAAIGTAILPGVGTAIGTVLGLVVGGLLGKFIGGLKFREKKEKPNKDSQIVGEQISQTAKRNQERYEASNSTSKRILSQLMLMGAILFPPIIGLGLLISPLLEFFRKRKTSDGIPLGEKILHPIRTKKESEMATQLGSGYVNMRQLGLKGSISSVNSIPFIKKENADNVKFLDSFFTSRGYKIDYTSAMGGGHAGGARSHASGNKLDYVLYKNGKQVRATKAEEAILTQMGFINANGAIGYHRNADGPGYHNDSHIGSGINLSATSEGRSWLASQAEENAKKAKEKAQKEAEEAKWRKEHPVQATVKDTANLVKQAVSANNNSKSDKTGIKDFVDRQNNTTNNLVNGGMR